MNEHTHTGHILVVEDDAEERKMLALTLQEAGFAVTAVGTFSQGMVHFERGDFDLYLLDQVLDNGSGVILCRSIRERDADTPIVFLSAYGSAPQMQVAYEAGATAFLLKPGDIVKLAETASQLIAENRQRKE